MMRTRVTDISCKEVINICDGTRYGYVNDVELDCTDGKVLSFIVHGGKLTSLFSKADDIIIPWEAVKRIGEDLILVDYVIEPCLTSKKTRFFSK